MSTIRLACTNCDRDDHDGITEEQLEQCKADGWEDIDEVQSYELSITAYPNLADAPSGFNVTAWYTHLGTCPDCNAEME